MKFTHKNTTHSFCKEIHKYRRHILGTFIDDTNIIFVIIYYNA